MGLQELALAGLGLVLVGGYSTKVRAGEGLGTLGAGITSILAAPGTGFGLGLQETAKGFKSLGEVLSSWFAWLPGNGGEGYVGPGGSGSGQLTPPAGGSGSDNLPGGGGNVPAPIYISEPSQNFTALPMPAPTIVGNLGRVYQIDGGLFGLRYLPGITFETRGQARSYKLSHESAPAPAVGVNNV